MEFLFCICMIKAHDIFMQNMQLQDYAGKQHVL